MNQFGTTSGFAATWAATLDLAANMIVTNDDAHFVPSLCSAMFDETKRESRPCHIFWSLCYGGFVFFLIHTFCTWVIKKNTFYVTIREQL